MRFLSYNLAKCNSNSVLLIFISSLGKWIHSAILPLPMNAGFARPFACLSAEELQSHVEIQWIFHDACSKLISVLVAGSFVILRHCPGFHIKRIANSLSPGMNYVNYRKTYPHHNFQSICLLVSWNVASCLDGL